MYLYPSRLVERLLPVCECVCARVRVVDSALSDFVWISHSCSDGNKGVFIVWYTFPPELFVLFTRNALFRIRTSVGL